MRKINYHLGAKIPSAKQTNFAIKENTSPLKEITEL